MASENAIPVTRTATSDSDSTNGNEMTIVDPNVIVIDTSKEAKFVQEEESKVELDPMNPLNWRPHKKWRILALVAFQGMLGPLTDSIYLPAILEVAAALQTDLTVINASVSVYMFGMGFSALFWAPFSEVAGRRIVYLTTAVIYVATSIACALSNSVGLFIVMRILQSFSAGAAGTVGAGTIVDMFPVEQRGTAVGIFFLGPLVGPVIGPIVGGYVAQYLGWHWIFWLLTIVGGIILLLNIFFLPETLYRPNLPVPVASATTVSGKIKSAFKSFPNPFKPLVMFRVPSVLLASFNLSFVFGWFYLLITVLPVAFTEDYGFSSGTIGLCYIANSVGNIIGAAGGGRILDILLVRLTARNKGISEPEMRVHVMWFGLFMVPLSLLIYGWTLNNGAHVALPLFGFFLLGLGVMTFMTGTNSYLVDSHPEASASVSAANNFMMSTWGAITPLFANAWRDSMHDGWMFTVIAILVAVVCFVNIMVLLFYGKYWRQRFHQ